MSYTPTEWKDRIVERPRTYQVQNNPDGTITLIPSPGTVVEPGTPVNAANLNKIEQELATISGDIVTVATPNKILKLNAQGKLPASITGDADTVDGKHASDFQSSNRVFGSAVYTDTIPADTVITKNIAIGAGKKLGMAVLSGYTAGYSTSAPSRRSVLVFFDTNETGAFIVGGHDNRDLGWGIGAAWTRSKLGKITEQYEGFGMCVAGTDKYSYVADLYISGTDLVIKYGNIRSEPQQISTTIEWVVW